MSAGTPRSVAPRVDPDSERFWAALADGVLLVPECRPAGHRFFPPLGSCPYCASTEIAQVEASGKGCVYSWVTIHIALDPAFAGEVPYTILAVDLEGGGRMFGRLLGDPGGAAVAAGAPVRFEAYGTGEQPLPGFRLEATDPTDSAEGEP